MSQLRMRLGISEDSGCLCQGGDSVRAVLGFLGMYWAGLGWFINLLYHITGSNWILWLWLV